MTDQRRGGDRRPQHLDLSGPGGVAGIRCWPTRRRADEHTDLAAGLRPVRARDTSGTTWILAGVLAVTDTTVRLRYLRTDDTTATATFERPDKLTIPADARVTTTAVVPLTAALVRQYLGRRVELVDHVGDRIDAELLELDEAHVIIRRHDRRGRLCLRSLATTSIVTEVPARHFITYSHGSVDIAGTEYVAFDGTPCVHTSLMYSAWCSCGEFRYHGDSEPRRWAVKKHLRDAPTSGGPPPDPRSP